MSTLNARIEQDHPGGYPTSTVLVFEYMGNTEYTTPMTQKHAIINAGYLLSLNPNTPRVQAVARLRDGTRVRLDGGWISDRDVMHLVRHYLWQRFLHTRHPVGPFEVPRWKPPPLPDAFGPPGEQLEYAPVE